MYNYFKRWVCKLNFLEPMFEKTCLILFNVHNQTTQTVYDAVGFSNYFFLHLIQSLICAKKLLNLLKTKKNH